MRKIIQIAACGTENTQSTQANLRVYALCDDGTIWSMSETQDWIKEPPIPQDQHLNEGTAS